MNKPSQLYRSNTYPYSSMSEGVERERFIETESGIYILTMEEEGIGFVLTLPSGKESKGFFCWIFRKIPSL